MNAPASTITPSDAVLHGRDVARCHIVGGGIAGLASAAYLVRDAGVPGERIHVLEASKPGGSLDAAGSAERGYSMRGSRMFGVAYVHSYDLFDSIPSLDDPGKSIAQDLFEFWQASPWFDRARLIEHGELVDATDWGLRARDRTDLIKLMLRDEPMLDGVPIDACFEADFFGSRFWQMWCSMFGFETWHSAAELRRYLLRFLLLFPDLETMQVIQCTRYNGHDSIVRPIVRWLEAQGVRIESGVVVTDMDFDDGGGARAVRRIHCTRDGADEAIDVGAHDLVIATLGSMTAGSSRGSMDAAPEPKADSPGPAWTLWRRLAAKDPVFGRPEVFCDHVEQTRWITFTVTASQPRFFEHMARLSGSEAGRGGLVTLTSSSWMLTFHLYPSPAYEGQPEGVGVWWGYGLFADRPGDFVAKPMLGCSGREILVELFSHLGLQDDLAALLAEANCVPCLLPFTTSQFMPRRSGDRPPVIPDGTARLALIGQYCEIPDNVVYTVEYSVHAARLAVASLLGFPDRLPPTYRGLDHPHALQLALRRILQ